MSRALSSLVLVCCLVPALVSAGDEPGVDRDQVSYGLGYQLGLDFKTIGLDVDADRLMKGLGDALGGAESALTQEQLRAAMEAVQEKRLRAAQTRREELARKNLEESDAFLAKNAKEEGVVSLPSGLQYRVLAPGEGDPPGPADSVTIHYRGTLIDGGEFDNSRGRNEPAAFRVDWTVPGLAEGLQLMRPGARYQLFVPPALGYGEAGGGETIPPNSALIFDVELLAVHRAD